MWCVRRADTILTMLRFSGVAVRGLENRANLQQKNSGCTAFLKCARAAGTHSFLFLIYSLLFLKKLS